MIQFFGRGLTFAFLKHPGRLTRQLEHTWASWKCDCAKDKKTKPDVEIICDSDQRGLCCICSYDILFIYKTVSQQYQSVQQKSQKKLFRILRIDHSVQLIPAKKILLEKVTFAVAHQCDMLKNRSLSICQKLNWIVGSLLNCASSSSLHPFESLTRSVSCSFKLA